MMEVTAPFLLFAPESHGLCLSSTAPLATRLAVDEIATAGRARGHLF